MTKLTNLLFLNSKSILLAAACSLALAGCSSAPQKKDTAQPVEQKKGPTRDESLGLKNGSIEAFETAIAELKKEKPDNKVALENLQKAVDLSPQFAEAQYNLGLLNLELGDAEKAVPALEKAREIDPDQQEYAVALGHAYAQMKRYDDAHKLFEEVVKLEPDNLNAKNNLAVLELMRGNNDLAITALQEILRQDAKNIPALNTMGRVYRQKKNLSLARYVYEEKALKVDPDNADLHNNLGLVFLDLKDIPNAVKHFEKATELNPNHLEAQINLGTILLEYLDYKRADKAFSEAVRFAPANCVARLGSAASKFALGDAEDAIDAYRYYVDNCDDSAIAAHEHLAKLYQSSANDKQKAIQEYKKLIEISTDEKQKKNYAAMANFLETQQKQEAQKPAEKEAPAKETPKEKAAPTQSEPPAENPQESEAEAPQEEAKEKTKEDAPSNSEEGAAKEETTNKGKK